VDYLGKASQFQFTENDDGTITVITPDHGTDTLDNIDGIWFSGEDKWYSINDLFSNDEVDQGEHNPFIGTEDDQTFVGQTENYSQVDLQGSKSDYVFTKNDDGTMTSSSDQYGTDTYEDIDGIWFLDEEVWSSTDGLI
jgi:hypothetical protein